MPSPASLCLIYGSAREARFCNTVAAWVHSQLAGQDHFSVSVVDPLDGLDTPQHNEILARAEAFIVITPEYNHSYSPALKAIIDGAKNEWAAKPVAFVSYGGLSGGVRAIEHLRGVFASLHTVGIREQISIANAHAAFDDNGQPRDPEGLNLAFSGVLARLVWWSDALSTARAKRPYQNAA